MSKEHHISPGKLYTGTIKRVPGCTRKDVRFMNEVREVTKLRANSSLQTERFVTYKVIWQRTPTARLNRTYTVNMRAFLNWVRYEAEPVMSYKMGKAIF